MRAATWILIALLVSLLSLAVAQGPGTDRAGGVKTLYALDPLGRAMSLETGEDGLVAQRGQAKARELDLDFHVHNPGQFTVGPQGGRIGRIVDLGTAAQLQERYGFDETVGMPRGFSSLAVDGEEIVIASSQGQPKRQAVVECRQLFGDAGAAASAPIALGHIYVVRLADEDDRQFERIAKLVVLAFAPGESVTFRWMRMR